MFKKLLISAASVLLILVISPFILVLFPVAQNHSEESLDFNRLADTSNEEMAFRELEFTARDGTSLFYRSIEGGQEVVLVLVHGSGLDGRYMLTLAEQLNSSANATVVVPDLRGHGQSAHDDMGDVSYLGQFDHDLEDLNLALRSQYPDAQLILGGHSSGGGLTIRYGGNQLAPFDRYLLLAPYLGYEAPTVKPNSGGWALASTRRYFGLILLNSFEITRLNGMDVVYFNRPEAFNDPMHPDAYTYRLNESYAPLSYEDELQANQKPVLLIVGRDDEAFHADQFEAVFSEYAPDAEVHTLPETKHLDLVSQSETATLITEWLESSNRSN
ncbi:MAG: alpha/beta hydrolase [Chloroflexota bacterium]